MKISQMKSGNPFLFLLFTCVLSMGVLFSASAQNGPGKRKAGAAAKVKASETVVYLVRHAEKAASNGNMTDDPDLSEAGQKRAEVLKTKFAAAPVAALFATKYKRTQQTLQPLATTLQQTVQIYDARDFTSLVEKIKKEYAGKTVVVAGHSNTVLSLLEALGGKKPFTEIADYQYDYLFKVTLREGKETQVDVQQYGQASTATAN
ncbi:SixA phosphatase family protein [Rufibacter hautae]|uniref:Histidine phosphatase family protein n=1 Tax=Rufibacter hautae TaxID=2595005 RepID=A0A5B6T927_9BACT|nr:histidine phosphatase family protein [Rufibacter hautae]KAA3436668.1 histidine phosphatase family protein [Rufibacter hautae]